MKKILINGETHNVIWSCGPSIEYCGDTVNIPWYEPKITEYLAIGREIVACYDDGSERVAIKAQTDSQACRLETELNARLAMRRDA